MCLAAHKLRGISQSLQSALEKATIILTSHNLDDIERLCTRVLIMRSGRNLIYDGKPGGLIQAGARQLKVQIDRNAVSRSGTCNSVTRLSRICRSSLEEGWRRRRAEDHSLQPQTRSDRPRPSIVSWANIKIVDMGIEETRASKKVIQNLYEEELTRCLNELNDQTAVATRRPQERLPRRDRVPRRISIRSAGFRLRAGRDSIHSLVCDVQTRRCRH